jgi:hypothetical protein
MTRLLTLLLALCFTLPTQAEDTAIAGLFAKTGRAAPTTPRIGWYVGYVETRDGTWLFALNLDRQRPYLYPHGMARDHGRMGSKNTAHPRMAAVFACRTSLGTGERMRFFS